MAVQFIKVIRNHLAQIPSPSDAAVLSAFDEACAYVETETGRQPNLEPFFEAIDDCLDAHYLGAKPPNGLVASRALERIHYETKRVIQEACDVRGRARVKYIEPLLQRLGSLAPFPIASFNYDSVIETACDSLALRYAESVLGEDTARAHIELIKVHGSITWLPGPKGKGLKRSSRYSSSIIRQFGELRSAVLETPMIYPSRRKMPIHAPFMRNAVRLQELLNTKKVCIVIGYSFPDLHVRSWFDAALEANPDLVVYLIGPTPEDQTFDNLTLNLPRHRWRERLRVVKMGFGEASKAGLEQVLANAEPFGPGLNYPRKVLRSSASSYICRDIRPSGLASSLDGNTLYITEGRTSSLWKIDLDSGRKELVASGLKDPRGVAVQPNGNLLVVQNRLFRNRRIPSAGAGTVLELTPDGRRVATLTCFRYSELAKFAGLLVRGTPWSRLRDSFRAALSWPTDVACDASGNIFVTEARALVRVQRGKTPERLCEPELVFNLHGVDVASDGALVGLEQGVGQTFSWGRITRFEFNTTGTRYMIGVGGNGQSRLMGLCFVHSLNCVVVAKTVTWPHGGFLVLDYPSLALSGFMDGFDFPQQVEYVPNRDLLAIGSLHGVELLPTRVLKTAST